MCSRQSASPAVASHFCLAVERNKIGAIKKKKKNEKAVPALALEGGARSFGSLHVDLINGNTDGGSVSESNGSFLFLFLCLTC